MNDDFIYKALPKVRRDFAQSLYTKISMDTNHHSKAQIHPMQRISRRLQVALILLGVLILVAWSQIRLWIRYVPIGDFWLVEFSNPQPGIEVQTAQPIPTPGSLPTMIVDGEILMLLPRYDYLPPAWIPDGFSPTQLPDSGSAYEDIIGMWSNNEQETIRLFVVPKTGGARPYALPGMYEEIDINGQPAILIFGRLAPNSSENPQAQREWDETLGLQLSWSIKDSLYTLETVGTYVSANDLIRMAESMKIVSGPEGVLPPE